MPVLEFFIIFIIGTVLGLLFAHCSENSGEPSERLRADLGEVCPFCGHTGVDGIITVGYAPKETRLNTKYECVKCGKDWEGQ